LTANANGSGEPTQTVALPPCCMSIETPLYVKSPCQGERHKDNHSPRIRKGYFSRITSANSTSFLFNLSHTS
jgi:hypothetical protein